MEGREIINEKTYSKRKYGINRGTWLVRKKKIELPKFKDYGHGNSKWGKINTLKKEQVNKII